LGLIKFTVAGLALALITLGAMPWLCFAQPEAAAPELSTASLGPQLFGENVISTADDESHPAFTPDGKTIYFLKSDPSFTRGNGFLYQQPRLC
jgi:WD40-like Beta Propeller Repeat